VRLPHRACGIGLLAVSLAIGPLSLADASLAPSTTDLVIAADEKAEAGRHAEAARLYKEAFDTMSADDRAQIGDVVVETGLESIYKAYKADPDPALLDLTAEFIESFESDMAGGAPKFIENARVWLAERRPQPAAATAGASGGDDGETPLDDDGGDDLGFDGDGGGGGGDDGGPPPKGDPVGGVLLGVGSAVTITGIILLATGSRLGPKAEEARDTLEMSDAYAARMNSTVPMVMMNFEQFVIDLDDFVVSETKKGKNVMIGGGVLLGVGIGIAAYGVVRLAQNRKKREGSARVEFLPSRGGLLMRF
jgi:hypothetical protein